MGDALLLGRPLAFERGDKIYLTTPLMLATPSDRQIEEYAFASAVKGQAPNQHIGWLQGKYVEAGRPNLNGAMWLTDELALKSLTPMLMPVTVMHDPRTAVGTIADCKLIGGAEQASTSRIDTILAIWRHRFPDIWEEAEANLTDGTMMQSMECLSPSYACSDCGQQYVKLPEGKEQASWCDHLRSNSSRRILQDVCFTGTGLIFGTRGGRGAYTEAYLDHFQDEIAEYHAKAHIDSNYRASERSTTSMALVQIEESELATLRQERNEARSRTDELSNANRDLGSKVEKAEADLSTERTRAEKAEEHAKSLEETAQRATLKEKRVSELGQGFLAKLGEFTRSRLNEQAATLSDEDWDGALKEREELAGLKRDAKAEEAPAGSSSGGGGSGETEAGGSSFSSEEVASFARNGVATHTPASAGSPGAARQLARAFKPKSRQTTAETK